MSLCLGRIVRVALSHRADLQNTDILAFGERRGQTVELAAISRQNVFDAIEGQFRDRLLEEATCGLEREEPQFSARQVVTRQQCAVFAALLVTAASALIVMPAVFGSALMGVLGLWFAANVAFRALLVWVGSGELRVEPLPSQPDRELPIYSILVPLYREANVLPALIGALKAIDYPADRIDAKLIVEADDAETNAAFETLSLDARFHVIRVTPVSAAHEAQGLQLCAAFRARGIRRHIRRRGPPGDGPASQGYRRVPRPAA
jgi:hypothetical protein